MIDSSRTPRHRQLQRARDRRRRQRQHVHLGAQLLQPLLVADAEMLLLVDHHQAEILERHGLAEHGVGADDDVDAAFGERPSWSRAARRRRPCATTGRSAPAARRTAGRSLGVLARQQRRRRDDRRLLAVDRRGEGGAQRDLGLAEADVAAHQPVHRPARGEIVERRLDGAAPGPASRHRGSGRRIRRRALGRNQPRRRRVRRWAAMRISSPAISRTRFFSRALRVCQPVEPRRSSSPCLRAVARQAARDSRPAGTTGRRRRNGSPGNRAARPPPRSSSGRRSGRRHGRCGRRDRRRSAPRPRPARPGRGACAWRCRTRRSPRMSCSPMTARSSDSKPRSSAITASGSAPARAVLRLRPGRDELLALQPVFGEHVARAARASRRSSRRRPP